MDDDSGTSEIIGKKMIPKERVPVEEYYRRQNPYDLIRQHIFPHQGTNQPFIAHASNEGRDVASNSKTKRQCKGNSTTVDSYPYNISLFDVTLDSGTPSKKKLKKDGSDHSTGYYEILRWEKELIHEHMDELKAMFEFKQIYSFIHKKKQLLNFPDVPLYIVERMFLMPQESSHLASVMTALLNHCFRLKGYSPEAPMPYRLWNSYLKMKVGEWYDIVASFGGDTLVATNYIGFYPDFFVVLGSTNPFKFCDFHDLNLLQRVWLVKSLCDSLMLDVEEASDKEADDGDGENFYCQLLGTDRHGHHYFYLLYFKEQENLRVYCLSKYFFPMAGCFYERIQRENHGQVAPCKKYHKLVADDVQSLRKLASKFAEPLETEAEVEMQNSGRSTRPDCESKLHQKLLDLLSKMDPLESKLKSSTLKLLMLLKSDWDRYHGSSWSAVNECEAYNCGNEVKNNSDKNSDYSDDSQLSNPVQHFLVSMVKSKRNVQQLKSIVPQLINPDKSQKLNLPNVCIIPLKKLNDNSQTGVEILTPFENKASCTKQVVICDSKVHLSHDVTSEDSDTDDSVLIIEPDTTEDNDLNSRGTIPLVKKGSSLTPLLTHSHSSVKAVDEDMDWETMSDGGSNSSEVSVQSSKSDVTEKIREENKSDFSSIFANTHKTAWYGSKQMSSSENSVLEIVGESNPRISECTAANKYQPLVIHIGNNTDANTKSTQLSSCDKKRDKRSVQDVQKADGLPYAVYIHNITDDISSQSKTSALSVLCNVEEKQRPSPVYTARKTFHSSRRTLSSSVGAREKNSTVIHGESSQRTSAHQNVSSRADDLSLFPRSVVASKELSFEHVISKSQSPIRVQRPMDSLHVSQIMKYPIVSLNILPCVVSDGLVHPAISPEKIAPFYETTHLKDTSPTKSAKLMIRKSFLPAGKSTQCLNRQLTVPDRDLSFSGRLVSRDNHSLPSTVLGEDDRIKVVNEASKVSNRKTSVKSCPISQQLIYTLSPMETSFTIRNSLESCISATEDHLHVCDNGKKNSLPEKYVCSNDIPSSDILTDSAKKRRIHNGNSNTSSQKTLNSYRSILKRPSTSTSLVASSPVSCTSSGNSDENSGDCLGESLLSHQTTTAFISPSEHISRCAVGTDVSADFSVATSDSGNIGNRDLIPVVLPDGKNILLRLVGSQSIPPKTSLPNSSSCTSQATKNTLQTVGTELGKKNANSNCLSAPSVTSQVTSLTKTDISQISLTTSSASCSAGEDSSFASDSHLGDSENNTKCGKCKNQDSSSEMGQRFTSSCVIPVSTSTGKVGKRMTYAQKIQEILKSSEAYDDVVSVEKPGDVSVEKSSDVVILEKTRSAKKLSSQSKTAFASSSKSSLVMPKVKKVEIPLMASKILNNLSFDGTTSIETASISSSVMSVTLCNSVPTPQVVNVNSGTVGFTGPINQPSGNMLNILNAGGSAPGGIIILGQSQSGNSTIFTQPVPPVSQTPLFLVPSVVSTRCKQPLMSPAVYTMPLLSNSMSPELNGIVSSSCIPNSQPSVFLCQNQLYMMPPVIPSKTFPAIAPIPPSPSKVSNSASHLEASTTETTNTSTENVNCTSNKENETEDGWEVVPDPLELTKVQFQNRQNVPKSCNVNSCPKEKKKNTVGSSSAQVPEFPGNTEPPVLATNKKATEKYNLNLKLRRPPLTLDEPITVIPSRKQDTQQNSSLQVPEQS